MLGLNLYQTPTLYNSFDTFSFETKAAANKTMTNLKYNHAKMTESVFLCLEGILAKVRQGLHKSLCKKTIMAIQNPIQLNFLTSPNIHGIPRSWIYKLY